MGALIPALESPPMEFSWSAQLDLRYSWERGRTVLRHHHSGPLRVLKSLYPEGDRVCHNVLVHPPSGLVGGDELDIAIHLDPQAHALITTPGATRFYGSTQKKARQKTRGHVGEHAKLEWLPMEALAYNGSWGVNQVVFELAPSASLIAWDVTQLGLPQAQQPFSEGAFEQHLEIHGVWLDKAKIDALDHRLLSSPLGLGGRRCFASLIFAQGQPLSQSACESALSGLRELIAQHLKPGQAHLSAGVTLPHPQVLVLRVLSDLVEPSKQLLKSAWALLRKDLWHVTQTPPRIWAS
jgi:urease accessory protein